MPIPIGLAIRGDAAGRAATRSGRMGTLAESWVPRSVREVRLSGSIVGRRSLRTPVSNACSLANQISASRVAWRACSASPTWCRSIALSAHSRALLCASARDALWTRSGKTVARTPSARAGRNSARTSLAAVFAMCHGSLLDECIVSAESVTADDQLTAAVQYVALERDAGASVFSESST
jgi:hypothetical protein